MPRPPTVRLVLDPETEQDIAALAAELHLTRSAVVRLAVSQLRKSYQQTQPQPAAPEEVERQRRPPGGPRGERPSRAAARPS